MLYVVVCGMPRYTLHYTAIPPLYVRTRHHHDCARGAALAPRGPPVARLAVKPSSRNDVTRHVGDVGVVMGAYARVRG